MKTISITYLNRFGEIKNWEIIPVGISYVRIENVNQEKWVLEGKVPKTLESKFYILENIKSIKEL